MRLLRHCSALLVLALLSPLPSSAAITYLGKGVLPYNATDLSGLTSTFPDGTPHNLLGGFGSAITYSGVGNRYYVTPDRGPGGGTVDYYDRFHEIDLQITDTGAGYTITPSLIQTTLLRTPAGANFTGLSSVFDTPYTTDGTRRLDPEGLVLDRNRTSIYVSDEYGPYIRQFSIADGTLIRALPLPAKFGIAAPNADGTLELPPANTSGRQSNRGMEGLAISPDGRKLFGIMQNALIQDGALSGTNSRIGFNNRILEYDLVTNATREYVYPLAAANLGVNEILAVNDHQFLVIERDSRGLGAGNSAVTKNLYLIDITGATDVSGIANLPTSGLPTGVTAVSKTLFLNLLSSTGIAAAQFPEKIEGLAFGPDLADGRHTLIVTNDNDFLGMVSPLVDNNFYVFAFDTIDLPNQQRQQFDLPVPTMVELFRAIDTADGVRIEWRTDDAQVSKVNVMRAEDPRTEWTAVEAPVNRSGLDRFIVDEAAGEGSSLWYRLDLSLRRGGTYSSQPLQVDRTGHSSGFALSPLTPTPMTGGAGVLSFSVPKAAAVRLSIVDVQGRTVAVLSDGVRQAGRYTEALDASDLAAGLYFVRMQSRNVDLRQRLVVVK